MKRPVSILVLLSLLLFPIAPALSTDAVPPEQEDRLSRGEVCSSYLFAGSVLSGIALYGIAPSFEKAGHPLLAGLCALGCLGTVLTGGVGFIGMVAGDVLSEKPKNEKKD